MGGRYLRSVLGVSLWLVAAACQGAQTSTAPTTAGPTATGGTTLTPAPAAPIRIGASLALTGESAPDSTLVRDGYEFWVKTVNDQGGINVGGTMRPVELVIRDDGSNRELAARLVEQLIAEEKVDLVLAPWGSGNTNAVAPIAERYGRVMVAPLASSDSVWEQGYQYLFGVLNVASENERPMVRLTQKLGLDRVAVVNTDDLFPDLGAQGAKDEIAKLGLDLVLDRTYPPGTVDVGALVTEIQGSDAQVVIAPMNPPDAIILVRQMKERGFVPPALNLQAAAQVPDFLSNVGADAEGIFGIANWFRTLPYSDPLFGTTDAYVAAFEAQFGYAPSQEPVAASAAGYVLQLAVEAAGSLDNTAVRDALRQLDVQTVFGPVRFDERGVNTRVSTYVFQVQSGAPVLVFPAMAASAEAVYPVGKWGSQP